MRLSVVVPTLNGRQRLVGTLDSLAEHVPDTEVVVVNGPSTDGTTGTVRDREDVDVLVEVADRTVAAARNAGIEHAVGDAVALVDHRFAVTRSWADAVAEAFAEADVVTGPVHERTWRSRPPGRPETDRIGGRDVTFVNGGNVVFRREILDAVDGFDEYLAVGSARDCAHRLAALDATVAFRTGMGVAPTVDADGTPQQVGTDGGVRERDRGWKYRSFAYRLVKNYGVRPAVVRRLAGLAGLDAAGSLRGVVRGDRTPSNWLATGTDVLGGIARGCIDGVRAHLLDRTPRRNPYGRSARTDRTVAVYDRR
jgi:glycosyltransferase involved in cell wall biosynthesis